MWSAFNAGALIGNAMILLCNILIPKRNQLPLHLLPSIERAGGEARISKLASGGAFNAGALIGNGIQLLNKI